MEPVQKFGCLIQFPCIVRVKVLRARARTHEPFHVHHGLFMCFGLTGKALQPSRKAIKENQCVSILAARLVCFVQDFRISCNRVTPFSWDRQIIRFPMFGLATLGPGIFGIIANWAIRILREMSERVVGSLWRHMAPLTLDVTLIALICLPFDGQRTRQV